jgi:hypothetical protein
MRPGDEPADGWDLSGELPEDVVIPDSLREAARDAPDHWLGVVDPEWPEDQPPPDWAVVGEWRTDSQGEVSEYRANPRYRPSARALGWPEPTDPVDAAAQRAATGYGAPEDAVAALAEAQVTVLRAADGGPLTAAGADGEPVLLVFTSPEHQFMHPTLLHDTLTARELARARRGAGTLLMVNPAASAPLMVPADSVCFSPEPKSSTAETRSGPVDSTSQGGSS